MAKIIPILEKNHKEMSTYLRYYIHDYITLFGTECLEELLNGLFDDMGQIKRIKIETKYKLGKKKIPIKLKGE